MLNVRERENGPGIGVYEALKDLVTNHRFRPYEHLHATNLSVRLGVSTTPVREALLRLYSEKLVITNPRRGFYLKPLNVRELCGICRVSFVILRHCIETDIQKFSLDGLSVPECLKSGADPGADRRDRLCPDDAGFIEQLYVRIAKLAGNQAAVEIIANANDRTHFVRVLDLEDSRTTAVISHDMCDLIHALQQRRSERAIANLRLQFDRQIARMNGLVKEGCARTHCADDGIL